MKRLPQGVYTPEFRAEAVKLVIEQKLSVAKMAKRLALPKNSLCNWVCAAKARKQWELVGYAMAEHMATSLVAQAPVSRSFTTGCASKLIRASCHPLLPACDIMPTLAA